VSPPPGAFSPGFLDDQAGLVPDGVDDCFLSSSFLYLALGSLAVMGLDPVAQEYTRREGIHQMIRALSTAASQAGVRVRDSGLLRNHSGDDLGAYTPEEIWTFDLAIDVIAMLGSLDGVSASTRANAASDLSSLDESVHSHRWQKELKKAGQGSPAFQELRAKVPRHKPHPERSFGGRHDANFPM